MWYKSKLAIIIYFVIGLVFIVGLTGGDSKNISSLSVSDIKKSENVLKKESKISLNKDDKKISYSSDYTYYKIIKVVDGDTISVSMNGKTETLRLIGINTPETVDPRKPVECFGKEASNKAKSILEGQSVRLEADPSQGERDKYNRLLRYVFLLDGTFFNKSMIQQGYAYEYTYNTPYKYQADFKTAELEARTAKRGLWADNACPAETVPSPLVSPITGSAQTSSTQPASSGQYVCSYNAYNCANFTSQSEAQAAFEACGGTSNDIHELDRDGDGRVCESLK